MTEQNKDALAALAIPVGSSLPLREAVVQTLRQAITDGTLQPGTRLMEVPLAQGLGVSRTPVREALRLLEEEGLVRVSQHRGTVVAQITETDLREVLEIRAALEELSVRSACRHMTPAILDELRRKELDFEKSLLRMDPKESAQLDDEFHSIIRRAACNRHLSALLDQMRQQIFRYRLENLKDEESYPYLIEEHRRLIAAFAHGNEDEAARLIRMHIDNQREAILARL